MTGMTMNLTVFGLLFLVGVGLLCVWRGRQCLQEARINRDAKGSAGCFFVMTALLFSAAAATAWMMLSH